MPCFLHRAFIHVPAVCLLMAVSFRTAGQSIERIQFSGLSSGGNSFQAVAGVPYGSYLSSGSGASLTVSSEYGKAVFIPLRVEPPAQGVSDMEVFPNPVMHELQIRRRSGIGKPQTLILFDALGREVSRQTLQGEHTCVDLSGLASGSYRLAGEGRSWQILKQ